MLYNKENCVGDSVSRRIQCLRLHVFLLSIIPGDQTSANFSSTFWSQHPSTGSIQVSIHAGGGLIMLCELQFLLDLLFWPSSRGTIFILTKLVPVKILQNWISICGIFRVGSANSSMMCFTMKMTKSRGPKTLPCGTLLVISFYSNYCSSITTRCILFDILLSSCLY